MNATDKFYARDAHVDAAAVAPLPNSRKIHVAGSRADIRVPMREIAQGDTDASFGAEKNPSIVVYDTSGPYTDPDRGDRHPQGPAGAAGGLDRRAQRHRRARRALVRLRPGAASRPRARRDALRPPPQAAPRLGCQRRRRQCFADALRAPRHRHARDGVRRDPREPEARGDAGRAARARDAPASGTELRRRDSGIHHAGVRARRGGPRPRDHSRQHQSPRDRADDHRPQLPREDQRQHRQLGGHVVDRTRKSRR